jgi:hypothetical protein
MKGKNRSSLPPKQIAQTKTDTCDRILATMKEKEQITDNQKAFIKRTQATRDRIRNPFPRPSKPIYQGQSHILMGVSLGLEKPATVPEDVAKMYQLK